MSFKSFGLSATILSTLEKQKLTEPTDIQKLGIPVGLANKDILGVANTGSGKTISYVLPLLTKVLKNKNYQNRYIKALIIVPTRELAVQVHEVVQTFTAGLYRPIKSLVAHGGVSINPQMIQMQNVEVLVATPGRLLDLHKNKALHFSDIDTFVMDEADKLLNLGFKKEIDEILKLLPYRKQSMLYSATLSEDVQNIHQLLLKDPVVINVKPEEEETSPIEQIAYMLTDETKGPILRYIIKEQKIEQVLVFTSSGQKAEKVANKLFKNGISAMPIHGKLSQGARAKALEKFKAKELRVLVATDLISRGIDIESLPYVINYELPRSPKDFIHRIGRTGRAGESGVAISLITKDDLRHFKVIMKKMGEYADLIQTEDIDLKGY